MYFWLNSDQKLIHISVGIAARNTKLGHNIPDFLLSVKSDYTLKKNLQVKMYLQANTTQCTQHNMRVMILAGGLTSTSSCFICVSFLHPSSQGDICCVRFVYVKSNSIYLHCGLGHSQDIIHQILVISIEIAKILNRPVQIFWHTVSPRTCLKWNEQV